MTPYPIYLKSYDRFDEVLQLTDGDCAILTKPDFEKLGVELTFGWFAREGNHVAGIFASSSGPVLFLDRQRVAARFGVTVASTESIDKSMRRFTLTHEGRLSFTLDYREREGIGTNPYDIEIEDVDLFALIAAGLRNEQYLRHYTSFQKY